MKLLTMVSLVGFLAFSSCSHFGSGQVGARDRCRRGVGAAHARGGAPQHALDYRGDERDAAARSKALPFPCSG